jgi:hypothetical protein
MYTATPSGTATSLTYCMNFTVARSNDNVSVNRSVAAGQGSVVTNANNRVLTNGQSINRGSTVTFTAVPAEGYKVYKWEMNGLDVGGNRSDSYVLTGIHSNANVTASFVPIEGTGFLNDMEPGARVEAVTSITKKARGRVYLAMYDAGGRLISIVTSREFYSDPENGIEDMVVTGITLPEDVTGVTVKAFAWDNDFVPVLPGATLE